MSVICFGLSHRTAAVDVRERFAIAPGALPAATARLRGVPGVAEAVVLSTCNRVEFYAAVEAPVGSTGVRRRAGEVFREYFAAEAHGGAGRDGLDCFYQHEGPGSVEHLFRVVSGLDSMVVGETEIAGQVKDAYGAASAQGVTGRVLNRLFQRAFRVAKEVRTQTGVGRGAVSVGSVAVDLAERLFGDLGDRKTLILGAGDTGERVARSLRSRGARSIFVSNRSFERAAALATELDGEAIRFERWERAAADADILIASTAAPHAVVTRAQVAPLMDLRAADRPLFIIDLAVPRDVEPAVNELEGVYLYDIDSLEAIARQARAVREQELAVGERLIAGHVAEWTDWTEREARRLGGESPGVAGAQGMPART